MSTPDQSTKPQRARRDEKWITLCYGLAQIRSSHSKPNREAFVYLIGALESNYTKIGLATDVDARLEELQTASPFTLIILARRRFDSKKTARRAERELHDRFGAIRVSGEWFRLSDTQQEALITELEAA